jgi:glycine cleavage system H lipoate-binding protein/ABC-type phosphate transport system substrate-binding protein
MQYDLAPFLDSLIYIKLIPMKKKICLQVGMLLLLAGMCITCSRDKAQEPSQKDKIVFNSSPELYDLTSEWANVFCTLNPEVEIEVIKTPESAIKENLDYTAQLSFVTSDFESEINDRALWKVTIGRDVIVPVINARNPYFQEISKQGISPARLARILNNPEHTRWSTIFENGPDLPINLYTTDDVTLHAGIARFLETDQVSFSEQNKRESKTLVASVQSDEYALGICYLMDMIDPQNKDLYEDIKILPIDRNGNGYIDYKEDVYASMDAFTRGVWIGKYPANLSNNIYTVSSYPPTNKSELAFLNWVITRGHVLLDNHGFGDLPEFERLAQVKIIDGIGDGQPGSGAYTLPKEPGFFTGPLPYILAFMLLLTLLLYFRIRIWNRRRETIPVQVPIIPGLAFSEDNIEISPGLYYDKTHTWAFLEKDGMVKVGIDDFIQRVTGPLTRIKMKSPGEYVKKGTHSVSIIQDGKQLDICAPVSGTIREQNTNLNTNATLLNSSPYSEGWIYKIEPSNWFKEAQFLLMGNHYKKWLKKEFQRLKDFLTDTLRFKDAGYVHVLQDGGELKENILKDLGPEMWEDFQTNFMDVS